jgi:DNA-binding transcriptional MocR family regulator
MYWHRVLHQYFSAKACSSKVCLGTSVCTVHLLTTDPSPRWCPRACRPKLLYTIPVHNNPCGTVLPAPRRAALVALAHRYGFTILADEVYQVCARTPALLPCTWRAVPTLLLSYVLPCSLQAPPLLAQGTAGCRPWGQGPPA